MPHAWMNLSNYTAYIQAHKHLLDSNYFKKPEFDCFYQIPSATSPPPTIPLTTVTPPKKCPIPPTVPNPDAPVGIPHNVLVGGISTVVVGCAVGIFIGIGIAIYRLKKKNDQPNEQLIRSEPVKGNSLHDLSSEEGTDDEESIEDTQL